MRSNTSVGGGRPSQRLTKRRLSTPYISPLTMIGEEDTNVDVFSATLPRHLEQRPKMLQLRGRSLTAGAAATRPGIRKTRGGTSPISGKKASFADEIELKPLAKKADRSPSPRRSPKPSPSEEERSESPVLARTPTKGRAPKLKVLGKLGSSGFYGDNEDDDDITEVDVRPSKVKIQLHEPEDEVKGDHLILPNAGAASAGNSPLQAKRETASRHEVTVPAEIHVNPDLEDGLRNNLTTAKVTFSDDTSAEPLLPSPEVRRKRRGFKNARTPSPMRNGRSRKPGDDEQPTGGESDKLLVSFGDESVDSGRTEEGGGVSRGANSTSKGLGLSLSLDRKSLAGIKDLNSALGESKGYMYHSLEDATLDYSQI